jgi:hypothetical protein
MIDPGYIESERTIVLDPPEYTASYHTVDLGESRVMTFAHLDVYYFSPAILRDLREKWRIFRENVDCVLFCMGDTDDAKFEKFVRMFGFQYLRDAQCSDGKTRRIFVNFGPAIGGHKQ